MTSPCISVVLCTHNRADVLGEALESLVRQYLAPADYEVIVIDNASSDETAEVVTRFPVVRCLRESRLGLSLARNRGIEAARGEVVAFIDDDAVADPGWLRALCSVYERLPQAAGVGGKIVPLWPPGGPPDWYGVELAAAFSCLDYGDELRALRYPQALYGTNMSFRRDVLQSVGGFRAELGRRGGGLMANEEVELTWRIERAGGRCYYTPEAVVWHRVPPERLRTGYLLRRAYGYGASTVLTEQFVAPASRAALLRRGLRDLAWEAPITLLRWLSSWLPWRSDLTYRTRQLLTLPDDLGRAVMALRLACTFGKAPA